MLLLPLSILVTFLGLQSANAEPKVSKVECLPPMYKCWVDFTDASKPNADVRITIYYDFMTGEETQFNAKISNLAEVTPFENFDYREDFEITYDIADHNIYQYEKINHDVHLMSEILTPMRFDRGFYLIKSNKVRISYIKTCPIFVFQGIRYGAKFCIGIDIHKRVDKADDSLNVVVAMEGLESYLIKIDQYGALSEYKV